MVALSCSDKWLSPHRTGGSAAQEYSAGNSKCDIIVLGTSHVLYGVYPQVLYDEEIYGVFNLGGYAQQIPTSYWIIKNAIDYGKPKPKIIILDTYTLLSNDKYPTENIDFLHSSVDSMPLTLDKYRMVKDIIPERSNEFLFSMYRYHNRWNNLNIRDFEVLRYYLPEYHGMENGAICNSEIKSENAPFVINENAYEEPHSVGRDYLEK